MKVKVEECPAGPWLDAAVAKALGWHEVEDNPDIRCRAWETTDGDLKTWEMTSYGSWQPSTDIAAALQLWQELAENHYVVSVCYGPGRDGRLYASVQMQLDMFLSEDLECRSPLEMDAKAETIPLAICRAFLKVHGVEFVEIPG